VRKRDEREIELSAMTIKIHQLGFQTWLKLIQMKIGNTCPGISLQGKGGEGEWRGERGEGRGRGERERERE
jgi:hypothetical protein